MMMGPQAIRFQVGLDGFWGAGGVQFHFAASADTIVRRNVRARRSFLQCNLNCLAAFRAFEGEGAWGFHEHGLTPGKRTILSGKDIDRRLLFGKTITALDFLLLC